MKRIITIMMVTALVAGAAFASGNNEENRGNNQGSRYDGESVLISGTVAELDGQVVLESGGELYSLSAPGFYRAGVEVPLGETVEVSGSMINEPCDDCKIDADGHIYVASATVGGEEISFETGRDNGQSGNRRASGSMDGSGQKNGSSRNNAQNGNRQDGNRQNGNRQGGGQKSGGGRWTETS